MKISIFILWILSLLAIYFISGLLYLTVRNKRRKVSSSATPSSPSSLKNAPSENQKLLEQLYRQRTENALQQYRLDCAALFEGLSQGILTMLAQEPRSCSKESVFCSRLIVCAKNESIRERLLTRKQKLKPILTETEATDTDELLRKLEAEKNSVFVPVINIPWDTLTEELIPCLESILQAAEEAQAENCRILLQKLRDILSKYDIYTIWFHENVIQENSAMQWDYTETSAYPVPTFYYHGKNDQYIHIGAPGCTGPNTVLRS